MKTIALTALLALAALARADGSARTRSPHAALATPCAACHTTADWRQIHFDHDGTGFALEGRHAEVACLSCHRVDRFARGAACLGCHADHHASALGEDCERCHTTAAWRPATFDHESTAFPLWGAHLTVACIQCHADERTYQMTPQPETCYDCHEAAFGRAAVGVHLTAGPDCQTCHTLDRWQGGHDPMWFEIRSGRHEQPCGRCHKQAPDYTTYTCSDCHEFSQREERGRD